LRVTTTTIEISCFSLYSFKKTDRNRVKEDFPLKAIVTGGCGFIGSHLAEKLVRCGYQVTVIDNLSTGRKTNLKHLPQVEIIEADLTEKNDGWMEAIDADDWVFHLAALADVLPSLQFPEKYFRSNVLGTYNLVEVCHSKRVGRFIYAASSSCYGVSKILPTPESAEVDIRHPYALTKRMGEEIVLHWARAFQLPATSLRLFNVYGPRSRTVGTYGAMFGVFLAQKLAGKPFTIVGDGTQTRDFTYVTDAAAAFLAAACSPITNQIFNVGSGRPVSVNSIVALMGGHAVYIPKRVGEPDCTFADISKIENELSWHPSISIQEGVRRMLNIIEDWKVTTVWSPESIAREASDWFQYLGRD
jgi:UDP-glucose 4-epimerase